MRRGRSCATLLGTATVAVILSSAGVHARVESLVGGDVDPCIPHLPIAIGRVSAASDRTAAAPTLAPWSQLYGSASHPADLLGQSVAIDGDVAVIGAIQPEAVPGTPAGPGVAYVFERVGNTWIQTAALTGSDSHPDDWFGIGVAVDGDRIVVGASGAVLLGSPGSFAGAAYVFEKIAESWVETARLTAPDPVAGAFFGYGVTVAGDEIGVGAFADDERGPWSGSVYVFRRVGGGWLLNQKVTASNAEPYSHFGETLDLDGDVLVVGAHIANGAAQFSGSAYVFERAGETWVETAWLIQSDGDVEDRFGQWVAASGSRVLIGARLDDDLGENAGAAYVFEKQPAGAWLETAKLHATNGHAWDVFGLRVDLEGDVAVIGGPAGSINGSTGAGVVQVFERDPTGWRQTLAYGEPGGLGWTSFGFSVAIDDGTVLVGAPGDDGRGNDSGSGFLFATVDADGDGYPDAHDDCPSVADPSQIDTDADGVGDACDGCSDVDHDDYGRPASASCPHAALDCDDTNAAVHPGGTELPGNGIDDDCNAATPGGCALP